MKHLEIVGLNIERSCWENTLCGGQFSANPSGHDAVHCTGTRVSMDKLAQRVIGLTC
jgi:hypothetical protein